MALAVVGVILPSAEVRLDIPVGVDRQPRCTSTQRFNNRHGLGRANHLLGLQSGVVRVLVHKLEHGIYVLLQLGSYRSRAGVLELAGAVSTALVRGMYASTPSKRPPSAYERLLEERQGGPPRRVVSKRPKSAKKSRAVSSQLTPPTIQDLRTVKVAESERKAQARENKQVERTVTRD